MKPFVRAPSIFLLGAPGRYICMLSTYSSGGARVPSAFVLTRSVAADAFAVSLSVTSPPRDKVAHRTLFSCSGDQLGGAVRAVTCVPSAPVRSSLRFLALGGDGGLRCAAFVPLVATVRVLKTKQNTNVLFPYRCGRRASARRGLGVWAPGAGPSCGHSDQPTRGRPYGRLRGGCNMVKLAGFGRRRNPFLWKGGSHLVFCLQRLCSTEQAYALILRINLGLLERSLM